MSATPIGAAEQLADRRQHEHAQVGLAVREVARARGAVSALALGMAMTTVRRRRSGGPTRGEHRCRVPTTGTPMIARGCAWRGSSSSMATGRYGLWGLRSSAVIVCSPPSPAPNTITGVAPPSADGRRNRSSASRHT